MEAFCKTQKERSLSEKTAVKKRIIIKRYRSLCKGLQREVSSVDSLGRTCSAAIPEWCLPRLAQSCVEHIFFCRQVALFLKVPSLFFQGIFQKGGSLRYAFGKPGRPSSTGIGHGSSSKSIPDPGARSSEVRNPTEIPCFFLRFSNIFLKKAFAQTIGNP